MIADDIIYDIGKSAYPSDWKEQNDMVCGCRGSRIKG